MRVPEVNPYDTLIGKRIDFLVNFGNAFDYLNEATESNPAVLMINGFIVTTYKNTTTNEWDYQLLRCDEPSIGNEIASYTVDVYDDYVIVNSRSCTDDNTVEDDINDTIAQIITDVDVVMGRKAYSNVVRIPRYYCEI